MGDEVVRAPRASRVRITRRSSSAISMRSVSSPTSRRSRPSTTPRAGRSRSRSAVELLLGYHELGDFIIVRYVIKNVGSAPLTEVWVGLYHDSRAGRRTRIPHGHPRAPAASTEAGTTRRWSPTTSRCVWCARIVARLSRCPLAVSSRSRPWAGMKLLTAPSSGQSVTVAAWSYAPAASFATRITRSTRS